MIPFDFISSKKKISSEASQNLVKMLLIRVILPLSLITIASCAVAGIPDNPLDVVKEGMEVADKALELYDKILDKVIPWKEFENTIKELDKYREDYSKEAGQLIGQIKTLLLNGMDTYFLSTQSIYEWCGTAVYQLNLYLKLFKETGPKSAAAQKALLVAVLDSGIKKMNEAQQKLSESTSAFNKVSGELLSLNTQLKNDFDKNSEYYNRQINKIRTEAYAGAASGAVFGIFGLIISYGTAAGIVENQLIPELNAKMESIKSFYVDLKQTIEKSNVDIDTTKTQLQTEIQTIGDLKVETENTQATISLDEFDALRDEIINAATKLINHCNDYKERHGKKKQS